MAIAAPTKSTRAIALEQLPLGRKPSMELYVHLFSIRVHLSKFLRLAQIELFRHLTTSSTTARRGPGRERRKGTLLNGYYINVFESGNPIGTSHFWNIKRCALIELVFNFASSGTLDHLNNVVRRMQEPRARGDTRGGSCSLRVGVNQPQAFRRWVSPLFLRNVLVET